MNDLPPDLGVESFAELTLDQRAFAAARLVERHPSSDALAKLALTLGVSASSIKRARAILRFAPEGEDEVTSGKTSLWAKERAIRRKRRGGRPPRNPTRRSAKPVVRRSNAPVEPFKAPFLTPAQVDPEFSGTPGEFTTKYGHVPVLTAEQYQTQRFGEWANFMRSGARAFRKLPPLPERPIDHGWLRSPNASDIAKLGAALDYLRPIIAEAEALLATAQASRERAPTNDEEETRSNDDDGARPDPRDAR